MSTNRAAATIAATMSTKRPGKASQAPAAVAPTLEGLELSDIAYKPASWFRENPANAIFRPLKSEAYLADLKRTIKKHGIVTPLVAMPDGLLIQGESRLLVARKLGIAKIPVMLILSPLSTEEQERVLILDNVSRFEIDEDTRLALFAKVWPGYFKGTGEGPGRASIAKSVGKSERQIIRDAAVVKAAAEISGGDPITPEHIGQAREKKNQERRASTSNQKLDTMTLRSALDKLDARGGDFAEAAEFIRGEVGL